MAVTDAGRVTIERDVVCGTGGDRELKCNIYIPPQPGTQRPAVLLVHGGSWVQGDRAQLHGYGILLGRIGYVCVAAEYRLAPKSKWPAQIHDVKAALRWMRANAVRLGIDPQKIAVSGNSAGGHLSLMVAATPNLPEFEGEGGNAGAGTEVAACIAFYPPTQLYIEDQPLREELSFLLGRGYSMETARAASPVTYADAHSAPTLLIHGNKDETVPAESSFSMYRALHDAGASVELHMYDGAPHGFDALPDFGRQCAAIMTLFLDRHVANPRAVVAATAAAV